MVKGMGVVEKAGVARVLDRGESPAGHIPAFQTDHIEPRLAQVSLEDQAVVTRTEDDGIVFRIHLNSNVPAGRRVVFR